MGENGRAEHRPVNNVTHSTCVKLERAFQSKGVTGLEIFLQHARNDWQIEALNVAVIGAIRNGKTALINALRGIGPNQEGAAPAGRVTSTTACYSHPEQSMLRLWDLPGAGSRTLRSADYWERLSISSYDLVLLVSSSNFTDTDLSFCNEAKKQGIPLIFVHTGTDQDYESYCRDCSDQNEEEFVSSLRCRIVSQLNGILTETSVFLVANPWPKRYDLNLLSGQLLAGFKSYRYNAVKRSVNNCCNRLLEQKSKTLRLQSVVICLFGALLSLNPVF